MTLANISALDGKPTRLVIDDVVLLQHKRIMKRDQPEQYL
jgi:hypothetical protein